MRLGIERELRPIRSTLAPSPADVASRADILSLHLALGPETRNLVNADAAVEAEARHDSSINTARGEVVDAAALAAAVQERGSACRARRLRERADVGDRRRSAIRWSPLPGVYGTHHIGASTNQAQEAIAAETVRIVRSYKETGHVPNVVNLARRTPATHMLVVRHRDRPGCSRTSSASCGAAT